MSEIPKKFYVYIDWTTEDVPRPFYVGKGTRQRIGLTYRNKFHSSISEKYGVERKIVLETEDENQAFDLEIKLISEHNTFVYGENYVWGANFTTGGEGASGRIASKETRAKLGFRKKHSQSSKLKMSKSRKGKKISASHKANIKRASTGRLHSNETKEKLRQMAIDQHKRQREQREKNDN